MWFDYNFHQAIEESGGQLATFLSAYYNLSTATGGGVVLIGHSMGGLVGRLAILTGRVPFVKKLFLLGTPNFGAVRTGRMAITALLAMRTAGELWGLFGRQPGIMDLTNVKKIFSKYLGDDPPLAQAAADVEYITIPGLFFHKNRDPIDQGDWAEWKGRTNWFTYLNVGLHLWNCYASLGKVEIAVPNDGIVEEESNRLIPPAREEEAYLTEKYAQIKVPAADHATYRMWLPPRHAN